jgi:hypothetical protein
LNDVIEGQRAIAALLLDEDERLAWQADPQSYAAAHLSSPAAAAMIAGLDPVGMAAMTHSHLVKKERFDYLHRLHHEHLDRLAAKAAAASGHTHDHDGHAHDHAHDHDHPHDHSHEGSHS